MVFRPAEGERLGKNLAFPVLAAENCLVLQDNAV
jgi:hypothetical protein